MILVRFEAHKRSRAVDAPRSLPFIDEFLDLLHCSLSRGLVHGRSRDSFDPKLPTPREDSLLRPADCATTCCTIRLKLDRLAIARVCHGTRLVGRQPQFTRHGNPVRTLPLGALRGRL